MHSRDTFRLIRVLKELQSLGNTVIVVEHDEDILRAADYLIDVGPDAGRLGGEIVYEGDNSLLQADADALIAQFSAFSHHQISYRPRDNSRPVLPQVVEQSH